MNPNDTPATYNGEVIPTPVVRYTLEQQFALLDWHPLFTGRCPNCEITMQQTTPPRIYWDCAACGWADDSV
ncbi:MAG: hypothetical protein F6K11_30485 [Leptolyngbya sp. SIO3F4]|nr:hypothetical protein [Leptolyngbya sp. SIO3F4]